MIKQIIIVAVVVQLVHSNSSPVDSRCRNLSHCPCQEVCVKKNENKICEERSNKLCECKSGCMVFDIFVPVNSTVIDLYGNSCRCEMGGQALCSKKAWDEQPAGVPVYESNPNCEV